MAKGMRLYYSPLLQAYLFVRDSGVTGCRCTAINIEGHRERFEAPRSWVAAWLWYCCFRPMRRRSTVQFILGEAPEVKQLVKCLGGVSYYRLARSDGRARGGRPQKEGMQYAAGM